MRYEITVSVNITELAADDGMSRSSSMLSYYKTYRLTGENFSDLAPRIDAVHEAIGLVADPESVS